MAVYLKSMMRGDNCADCQPNPCSDCCLYPWPDPDGETGGPFYPPEDLPDAVLVNGVTIYTHVVGTYYLDSDDGFRLRPGLAADGVGRDGFWMSERISDGALPATAGRCLIDPTVIGGIEDQFNDHYDAGGDTLTRITPCTWTGVKSGGGTWTLDYGITTPFKLHLSSTGVSPTSDDKTDPQDGPSGTYGSVTVS